MKYLDLYKYLNYREFLAEYHLARKAQNTKFSHRFFAKQAGYTSSGLYSHLINGTLNLTAHYLPGFIKALKLDENETAYFELLVEYTHASSDQQRGRIFERMVPLIPVETRKMRVRQREFYSKWYHSSILLLLEMDNYSENLKDLSLKLFPKISLPQCKSAIRLLSDLELIKKVNGFWKPTVGSTIAGKEVGAEVIRNHQKDLMKIASNSLEEFEPEERYVTTQAISMSEETMQKVKFEIQKMQNTVKALLRNDIHPNQVFHLNIQLFPTSTPKATDEN
jgi:uncharacterized protein (TIGR02147 family)